MKPGGRPTSCKCQHCRKAVSTGFVTLFAGPNMRVRSPFACSCEGSSSRNGYALGAL